MSADEVAEVKPRRLRDIRADLDAIRAEMGAIIANYPPPEHPARVAAEEEGLL
jgi:hypothetical protein